MAVCAGGGVVTVTDDSVCVCVYVCVCVCAGGGVVTVTDDCVCVQEGAWSQ